MELLQLLTAIPVAGPVLPFVPIAVAGGAVAARFMPPPTKPTGWYAALYWVANALGQNAGHAANANANAK